MAIPDADKLTIYNAALRHLGSRKLASVDESREPRRVLDDIWGTADEFILEALEEAEWNFAIRTVEGVYSTSVEPDFGFQRAYDKPDDMRRLVSLSADARFQQPLTSRDFQDEAGYWFTDLDVVYVRYVSDDEDYGLDATKWSKAFKTYVECALAWEACERITNSTSKLDRIERKRDRALKGAKAHDAMAEGTKFPPRGSWLRARSGGYSQDFER